MSAPPLALYDSLALHSGPPPCPSLPRLTAIIKDVPSVSALPPEYSDKHTLHAAPPSAICCPSPFSCLVASGKESPCVSCTAACAE